jgi:hypothetical protein
MKYKGIIKKCLALLLYCVVAVASFFISVDLFISNRSFQTFVARLASDYVSQKTGTDIRIGGFRLSLFRGLVIREIHVLDRKKTEMFAARQIGVVPGAFHPRTRRLTVKKIWVDHGVIQLITHRNDTVLNLQHLLNFFSSGDTTKKPSTTPSKQWWMMVSTVEITDTRFHFQDENAPKADTGMDYANIDVDHINLLITDLHPDKDTINATIKSLSAVERSGMTVRSMSGEFQVSPAFLKARGLKLVTANSDIDLDMAFLYSGWNAYNDFLNKVRIEATIRPTELDLEDIGNFAPELYVMKDRFHLSGEIRGTVSNFRARNFRFAFGKDTRFYGNISANGLPNVEETFIDLNIHSLVTSAADIEGLYLPVESRTLSLPAILKNAGICRLKGNFTGFYNDFVTSCELQTEIGSLTTDLTLRKQKKEVPIEYKGQVTVTQFHLGSLFNSQDLLGSISFRGGISGSSFNPKLMDVTMNMTIDSVGIKNYVYRDIDVKGELAHERFTGHLDVKDPNLLLGFNGVADFSDSIPSFDFTSEIPHANLFATHLLARDSILSLSTILKVKFTGSGLDNLNGSIDIGKTRYIEGKDTISMTHLGLVTLRDANQNKVYNLTSDFADADVSGDFKFSTLVPSVFGFIQNYMASFRRRDSLIIRNAPTDQFVKFSIRLKNTDPVMKVFAPFLRMAPDTKFEGFFSGDPAMIKITGGSPDLAIEGIHLINWFLRATNLPEDLNIRTGCRKVNYGRGLRPDSIRMNIDTFSMVADIRRDSVNYTIKWLDWHNRSEIRGYLSLVKSPLLELQFSKFRIFVDRKFWELPSDNLVTIDTTAIGLTDLAFTSGDQLIRLDGKISSSPLDTLYTSFNKIDISDLDKLQKNMDIDVNGILSGNAKLTDIYHGLRILSDLRLDKFSFNGEPLGDATFGINYSAMDKRFDVDAQILYTGNIGTSTPFSLTGSMFLSEKDPHLDFLVGVKNLNLKMAAPFVSSFMSRVSGLVSGEVAVKGKLSDPKIHGKLELLRTEFRINYLNVPYSVAGPVLVDTTAFVFDNLTIFDSIGNKAMLNGRISHERFGKIALDLNIDVNDFSAFKNSYAQNNIFYGNARATGNVKVTGPIDNITISVKAQSGTGTHVVIPISSTADISQGDYIVFVHPENDSLSKSPTNRVMQSGLNLGLALQVNPTAQVEVFFPDQIGNIKVYGSGDLRMDMTPTTGFSLSGIYRIQKGSFIFQLKNLMRLVFTLREGGSIQWKGDPADATLSLSAVYKTRVSMSTITTDPSMSSMRIPVECIIRLNGKLMNPDISFGMDLPNVQEDIKQVVYTAIDTSNQAVMAQQALNILVLNQFQAAQGGTPSVGVTSLGILSSQVNSMLSKISKNVNVGVNYRQTTGANASQEFNVAVSTELFSDRLLVDGLFGVNNYTQSSSSGQQVSQIVGDINIEYLLTKNGRLRLKAFNRTNTIDILTNNAPYTQGLGIKYERDFNKVSELFGKKKKKEKEKEKN